MGSRREGWEKEKWFCSLGMDGKVFFLRSVEVLLAYSSPHFKSSKPPKSGRLG